MNIIVQLQGGLGNQLFQYATARALATHHQASLALDVAWYGKSDEDVTSRKMQLSELNIDASIIDRSPLITPPKKIRKLIHQLFPINPYFFKEKRPYRYERQLFAASPYKNQEMYLLGYWQSYKYFEKLKNLLRKELTPNYSLTFEYQAYLQKIQSTESVMVHVRRGDYINLASAAKVHGCLELEYYQKGMQIFIEMGPSMHFFVFSDDIEWAKRYLPFQDRCSFVQVSVEKESAPQELYLMSQCKRHLIANSSLSWWGAWLAHEDHQINTVICPKSWTTDYQAHWDDLLPSSWLRI
ncbi:alpha-1,2-fucosyltransferase [Polynucleobacter brandtiae]|uniref:Glycosyl transferase family 11 n=1 Tax=Polynucleobacter brandtiae TaxID=1938816 RepID=A0A2M8VR53_9BURK|nr:alpha-1,2-fucosyltransferase [Polynucleobacter brandtiae]PJI79938.1 glycosyl transferase family 11 [Polynucleobacter brandtiae]